MKYIWIVIFTLSALTAFGQKSARVRQLEEQRKKALDEIEMTNQLLKETTQTAQNSLNRLNLLSQQILSRKKVISLLNQEVSEIDNQIAAARREINKLEKELGEKRTNYGKSAQSLYKRRNSQDKLLFILSADNFAQSMRRMRYLREYSDWQKHQATEIIDKQTEINLKQRELEKTRSEKNVLLGTREQESQKLQTEESSQKVEVQQLNKKQKQLKDELRKKQQQANALNRQIEKQIAEEIARAEAEAKAARERERRAREKANAKAKAEGKEPVQEPIEEERVADTKGGYAMTKAEKKLSDDFASNRGRLPFPGGDARAIFNGEVTRVFVVPGYNNSVIVRHGNYLTVYSNLSQVYVKAGDKVSTRQAIGKIFTDTEAGNTTILHFQLWKEKTKLNPTPWLD